MANPANNAALVRANAAANNNQGGNAVGSAKQACPLYDVIVIVAGTVDPVNSELDKLANSYETPNSSIPRPPSYDKAAHDPRHPNESQKDSNYYWSENPKFVGKLVAFQGSHDHVMVFRDHSWSGDNCVKNRQLAGQIFVDWLSGKGMPSALPAYLTRKVSFHLIGHSHGGNVINEMTLRMAKNGKWPADWKVKSVVYLSTPFFQKIHKPTTAKFHGAAKICNVFCKYDLTQTAIADFSLRQLTRVTNVVVSAETTIMPLVDKIVKFDTGSLWALATPPKPSVNWDWLNTSVEWTWKMDPTKGRNLYDKVLDLIKNIKLVFDRVKEMVIDLNKPVPTRISETFQGKGFTTSRKILPDAVKNKIIAELDLVLAGTGPAERAFKARIASGVYPGKGFFSDIHTESLVLPLIHLLQVDPGSLRGKIPDLLFEAFQELIEVFDDTLHTCGHLYKIPIVAVDVSRHDMYYRKRDPQFDRFKAALIKVEQAYMGNPTRYQFSHMLFLLAGQIEDVRSKLSMADGAAKAIDFILDRIDKTTSFYARMKDLTQVIHSWWNVFDTRYCQGIEADMTRVDLEREEREAAQDEAAQAALDAMDRKKPRPKKKAPVLTPKQKKAADEKAMDRKPKYGSVPYLATVSHSVSRKELYSPVDTFLRAQFDSHVVPPKR